MCVFVLTTCPEVVCEVAGSRSHST